MLSQFVVREAPLAGDVLLDGGALGDPLVALAEQRLPALALPSELAANLGGCRYWGILSYFLVFSLEYPITYSGLE